MTTSFSVFAETSNKISRTSEKPRHHHSPSAQNSEDFSGEFARTENPISLSILVLSALSISISESPVVSGCHFKGQPFSTVVDSGAFP
jgi:hypothetical protein